MKLPLFSNSSLAALTALSVTTATVSFISCSDTPSGEEAVIESPPHGKVDLSKVSLKVTNAKLTSQTNNTLALDFDYTLINKAGATISFQSIFAGKDDLIQVQLVDRNGSEIGMGKREGDGLTLAQARAILIPKGKSTRHYSIPVLWELREKGDPITLKVKFHAPSRYDELRTTLESAPITLLWPGSYGEDSE